MKAMGLLALGLLLMACGSLDQGKVTTPGTASTRADAGMGATPVTQSSVTTHPIGTELTTSAGNTLKLHGVDSNVTSSNQFIQPAPGKKYFAVDMGGCASRANTGATSLNMFSFTLQMPDDTRLPPTIAAREPGLGAVELVPGDCARGWVTFEVPLTQQPVVLNYTSIGGSTVLKWSLRP